MTSLSSVQSASSPSSYHSSTPKTLVVKPDDTSSPPGLPQNVYSGLGVLGSTTTPTSSGTGLVGHGFSLPPASLLTAGHHHSSLSLGLTTPDPSPQYSSASLDVSLNNRYQSHPHHLIKPPSIAVKLEEEHAAHVHARAVNNSLSIVSSDPANIVSVGAN